MGVLYNNNGTLEQLDAGGFTPISIDDWNQKTPAQKMVGRWYITGAENASILTALVNKFTIASTDWVANTGSDATDFPYVCNIATTDYSDTFVPAEVMLLGADPSEYVTSTEQGAIDLVNQYVKFSATGIRLRATDAPAVTLSLIVRGGLTDDAQTAPLVNTYPLLAASWTANAGSDASEFPYVYEISTTEYSDSFIANEVLILGTNINTYMSDAELEAKDLIDEYVLINSTTIRLRATGEPDTNLTLVIKK